MKNAVERAVLIDERLDPGRSLIGPVQHLNARQVAGPLPFADGDRQASLVPAGGGDTGAAGGQQRAGGAPDSRRRSRHEETLACEIVR